MIHPINFHFPVSIQRRFRRLAREAYPRETYAFLLGTRSAKKWKVCTLWVPSDTRQHARKDTVWEPDEWFEDAMSCARVMGRRYTVLGDIHSHPFDSCEAQIQPSMDDWEQYMQHPRYWGRVMVICNVWKSGAGHRSMIKVFGPMTPITVKER